MTNLALIAALCLTTLTGAATARSPETDATAGMQAFATNCFSTVLTADKAAQVFNLANLRHDFYDLDPVSNIPPSPAQASPVTPGTDRRCEVAFDFDFALQAAQAAEDALIEEGITTQADVPAAFQATKGTALLVARQLNPNRVAVVHVGIRPGKNGIETFMSVVRLLPSNQ